MLKTTTLVEKGHEDKDILLAKVFCLHLEH